MFDAYITDMSFCFCDAKNFCSHPLNSLLVLNENMLATGDDQGVIKV
jgi:hypothetical protein